MIYTEIKKKLIEYFDTFEDEIITLNMGGHGVVFHARNTFKANVFRIEKTDQKKRQKCPVCKSSKTVLEKMLEAFQNERFDISEHGYKSRNCFNSKNRK